jgi:hypothetical protein
MATLLKVLNNLADIKSAGGVALRVRTQGLLTVFIHGVQNTLTRTFATIAASSRRSARVESRSLPRFEMSPWWQRFWRSGVETTATDSLRSSGPSSRIQANVVTSSGPVGMAFVFVRYAVGAVEALS